MFFKISQNEIWNFGRNLPMAKFSSGRVKVKYNVFFVVYKRQNLGSVRVWMFYFISFFNAFIADLYIIINFLFNHSLIKFKQ